MEKKEEKEEKKEGKKADTVSWAHVINSHLPLATNEVFLDLPIV